MSVAIVAMVNHTAIHQAEEVRDDECDSVLGTNQVIEYNYLTLLSYHIIIYYQFDLKLIGILANDFQHFFFLFINCPAIVTNFPSDIHFLYYIYKYNYRAFV